MPPSSTSAPQSATSPPPPRSGPARAAAALDRVRVRARAEQRARGPRIEHRLVAAEVQRARAHVVDHRRVRAALQQRDHELVRGAPYTRPEQQRVALLVAAELLGGTVASVCAIDASATASPWPKYGMPAGDHAGSVGVPETELRRVGLPAPSRSSTPPRPGRAAPRPARRYARGERLMSRCSSSGATAPARPWPTQLRQDLGRVQIVSSHTTSMARGRLGSLPLRGGVRPGRVPVRASIFACLPACISEWDAADPVAEPVDLCAFPRPTPRRRSRWARPPTLAVAAAPARRARSPAEDASPA